MRQKGRIVGASILALVILAAISCDDTTEFKSGELFNPSVQGQLASDTLYAELDTTYSIPVPSTRFASRVLIGSFAGFTCRPILKFDGLPTNATIYDAYIRFISTGITGNNLQPFTIRAVPILSDWTTNTDQVWDDYQQNIDPNTILATMEVTVDSSDTLIMQMDSVGVDFFNRWVKEDSSEFNYGFLLDFDNADFIKEFYSNSSANGPQVVLTYALPQDTTRKDSFRATSDAFLTESHFSISPDRDYIVSLSPMVTLLQFDTTPVEKKKGIIVSANLQLSVDSLNTHINEVYGVYARIQKLTSDLKDSVVVIDSSLSGLSSYAIDITRYDKSESYIEINTGSERRDFGALYIQDLTEDPQPIKKLYVGFRSNVDFLSYIALLKRDQPDISKRPRLIVEYWIPPDYRY